MSGHAGERSSGLNGTAETVTVGWDVPGQGRAATLLRRAVATDALAHAWAFVGPAEVGQAAPARTLAAALLCPSVREGSPCGVCHVCRRCARGAHPGQTELAPTGAMHRVADVRERWLTEASRTPAEGRWKLLHVRSADRMNETAANAFLKALEEPPPGTVWVLDIADPDELPDTILSRCAQAPVGPLDESALRHQGQALGLAGEDLVLAVRACLGSPQRLERLVATGGLDDFRAHRCIPRRLRVEGPGYALLAARALDDEAKRRAAAVKADAARERDALEELYGAEVPRPVVREVEQRATRREREARLATVQAALDDLGGGYRDCRGVGTGGDPRAAISADEPAALREDAEAYGPAGLLRACDLVVDVREGLEQNLQQTLALEALFLEISSLTLVPVR